jgi:hypothetical protein
MLVSHKHKFVFVHLGKTGGDSFTEAFGPLCNSNPTDVNKENTILHPKFIKHAKIWEIQQAFECLGWNLNDYYKFMVIRNPFEVLHSDYYYHKFVGIKNFPDGPPDENIQDYAWHLKCYETINKSFEDYIKEVYGYWDKGFLGNWARDKNGNMLINKIIRHEKMESDFKELCNTIGITNIQLPKVNVTSDLLKISRPSPKNDFTPDLIELVKRVFKEEIAIYGYSLEEAK